VAPAIFEFELVKSW